MKKSFGIIIFFFMILNVSFCHTLTVNGFSRTGVDANREVTLQAAEKIGMGFFNWEVTSGNVNLDDAESPRTTFLMPDEDVTIVANYISNAILTVNPGGETYVGSYKEKKSVAAPAQPNYTITYIGMGDDNTTDTAPKIFEKWTLDGEGSMNNEIANPVIYTYGDGAGILTANYTISSVTLPSPIKAGHTFLGWYTAAVGGNRVGGAGNSYTPSADSDPNITLYAQWTVNSYNLAVTPGDGVYPGEYNSQREVSSPSQTYTVTYVYGNGEPNESLEVEKPFYEWQLTGGGIINDSKADPVIYTYGASDGILNAIYNSTAINLPAPTYPGYALAGWYTEPTGGAKVGNGGASYSIASDVTLYAHWSDGAYEIDTTPLSYTTTLSDAVAVAASGNRITLLSDVTEMTSAVIPAEKSITLNLNGNTIVTSQSDYITVNGGLTIEDSGNGGIESSAANAKVINVMGLGNLVVKGGTLTATGETSYGIYSGSSTSTVTLGVLDENVNEVPAITGSSYGVYSLGTVKYYDGTTKGSLGSVHATISNTAPSLIFAEAMNEEDYIVGELIPSHVTTNLINFYNFKYVAGANKWSNINDKIIDLMGRNNGTPSGNAYTADHAFNFNGSSHWINLGARNIDNPTLEVVFNPDKVDTNMCIFSNAQSGGYSLELEAAGTLVMGVHINDAWRRARTTEPLEVGRKYHAIGTYDGTAVRLYLDGVEVATTPITGAITTTTNSTVLALGTNPNGTSKDGSLFDGKIYMARVYDRALSNSEVAQNYRAAIQGKDKHDIHTGGTVVNNGICTTCSTKYVNITGFQLNKVSKYTYYINGSKYTDKRTVFVAAGGSDADKIKDVYVKISADANIASGGITFASSDTSVATYSSSRITGKSGGFITLSATAGVWDDEIYGFIYNATLTSSATSSAYRAYTSKDGTYYDDTVNANSSEGYGKGYFILTSKYKYNSDPTYRYKIYGMYGANAKAAFCNTWVKYYSSGSRWGYFGL